MLEAVDEDELLELRTQVKMIKSYFDDGENTVELEYLLTTATVTNPD